MASLRQLQEMDPYDFEELVADLWEAKGYDTTVRQGSKDRGIDVEANKGAQRILIQAKRYSSGNKVGAEEVRKYATLWQQEPDASMVILVTTSSFTSEAKRIAAEQQVTIINGAKFVEMMRESDITKDSVSQSHFNRKSDKDDNSNKYYKKEDKLFKKLEIPPDTMASLAGGTITTIGIIYKIIIGIEFLFSLFILVAWIVNGEIVRGIIISIIVFAILASITKFIHYIIQRILGREKELFEKRERELKYRN